jgi:hypothetical protein
MDKGKDNLYIGHTNVVFVENKDGSKSRFPKKSSIWANPYKINKHTTREQVVKKYETYIRKKITKDPAKYDINTLKSKNLGCLCKPDACHGDVLKKIVLESEKKAEF